MKFHIKFVEWMESIGVHHFFMMKILKTTWKQYFSQKKQTIQCWRIVLAWSFWDVIIFFWLNHLMIRWCHQWKLFICSLSWMRLKKVYVFSSFCCIFCAFVFSFCIEWFQNSWPIWTISSLMQCTFSLLKLMIWKNTCRFSLEKSNHSFNVGLYYCFYALFINMRQRERLDVHVELAKTEKKKCVVESEDAVENGNNWKNCDEIHSCLNLVGQWKARNTVLCSRSNV